ncbi:unnamed protein product [Lactuca virosa]|uniref:F-box domain-containing protein n=1 Tax=Lactuca virosa TaxID=75947 RepID=A0AAU9MY13_9ASTR|nr:unnamed protein product [Lactuca virosa]
MPDKLPFHIQEEIIKRLPIKSLVRFSVTQPQHLLLRYEDPVETADKYVSFLDDDTFPKQRFVHPLPLSVKLLKPSSFVGSSHGLFCLHGYYWDRDDSFPNLEASVLFNPSVRKSIVVSMPKKDHEFYKSHESVLGFGVFPNTNDPFVIQITQFRMLKKRSETSDPWKVDVYTLSSGNWRSLSRNLPSKSFGVTEPQVIIDRFIYWSALQTKIIDSELQTHNPIMSFDMSNESFKVVNLPDSSSSPIQSLLELSISIFKLRDTLAMVELRLENDRYVSVVWMMENNVEKSFTKLFKIKMPFRSIVLGFRKSGEAIMEVENDDDYTFEQSKLVVYDPNLDQFNDVEICGTSESFFVKSYTETLLLIGCSDCVSYEHELESKIMNALQRRVKSMPLLDQEIEEDDIFRLFEVDIN